MQVCDASDPEFPEWAGCEGDALPGDETCGDGLDDDCDGLADEGCGDAYECGPGDLPEPEDCDNGVDDDCDGLADCNDGECDCSAPDDGGQQPCGAREECGDGPDNDCDGLADCDDGDCDCGGPDDGGQQQCDVFEDDECADGLDNDCNGQADCTDFWCQFTVDGCLEECLRNSVGEDTAERCSDGADNDCDWYWDCLDPECRALGEDVPVPWGVAFPWWRPGGSTRSSACCTRTIGAVDSRGRATGAPHHPSGEPDHVDDLLHQRSLPTRVLPMTISEEGDGWVKGPHLG